jgi:hypothetical protein
VPGVRTCVLCGSDGPFTREHSPPTWVGEELVSRFEVQEGFTSERYGKAYGATTMGHAVRAVCAQCRDWVNDNIEHAARHLTPRFLFGEAAEFSAEDASLLATWVAYNAMMQWLHAPEAFEGFTTDDFRTLREAMRPPPSHVIWVGIREWHRRVVRSVPVRR